MATERCRDCGTPPPWRAAVCPLCEACSAASERWVLAGLGLFVILAVSAALVR